MAAETCDYVGIVDLGEGPIKAPCTVLGPHEDHQCVINLGKGPRDAPMRYNIFDDDDD